VKLATYALLGARQQRHRDGSDCRERDPDPARLSMRADCKRANRLDRHVCGKGEEASGDQLLGTTFSGLRVKPAAGEEPDDDKAGESLDQAVGTEADQRDRTGGDPRANRDRELDEVPRDPAPR
jgi:hypothetical protein